MRPELGGNTEVAEAGEDLSEVGLHPFRIGPTTTLAGGGGGAAEGDP